MFSSRQARRVVSVATLAVVLGAAQSCSSAESATETSTAASETDATEAPATTEATATPSTDGEDAATTAAAAPLPMGGPAEPGSYTTDLMGTEITMDLATAWFIPGGDPGGLVMVDAATQQDTSEVLLITRSNSMPASLEAATIKLLESRFSGPVDIEAWVAAVGELEITDTQEVTVGGMDAKQYDVVLAASGSASLPGGCGPGPDDRCFLVAASPSEMLRFFIVRTTEVYRFWVVDQGSEDPILITAIAHETSPEWLDNVAQPLVDSLTLGPVAPTPVEVPTEMAWEQGFNGIADAGEVTMPGFGGTVTVTLPEQTAVSPGGYCLVLTPTASLDSPGFLPPTVKMMQAYTHGLPEGTDELPPASVESTLDFLGDDVTPNGETITVFDTKLEGYHLTGYNLDGEPPFDAMLNCGGPDVKSNQELFPAGYGTLYLGTADDGGVLVVSAEALTEGGVSAINDYLEALVPTLKLD